MTRRLINKHDGAGLAKRARQLPPDLPIVYACGRSGYRAIGTLVARSVFLAKPHDPADVGTLLEAE